MNVKFIIIEYIYLKVKLLEDQRKQDMIKI